MTQCRRARKAPQPLLAAAAMPPFAARAQQREEGDFPFLGLSPDTPCPPPYVSDRVAFSQRKGVFSVLEGSDGAISIGCTIVLQIVDHVASLKFSVGNTHSPMLMVIIVI